MANLGSLMFQVGADTAPLKRAEGEVKRSASAMEQSLISVGSAAKLAIGAFAANELRKFTSEVVSTGMKLQQLSLSFKAITGSAQASSEEMLFIKATANTMGQSFMTVADAYKGIAAAAKGTSLEGKATRDIFEAISGASTVLGLSAEQTGRSLYALSQMISKGKVSSEELRQQLGENLPGAFNIAADAMNMTTQEFDKMLSEGKIMTEDFLPKFSAAMQEKFGKSVSDSAKSAQAATNRLGNAFVELQDAIWKKGESSYTSFVSWTAEVVNSTAGMVTSIGEGGQAVNRFGKTVEETGEKTESFLSTFSKNLATSATSWARTFDEAQRKVIDFGAELLNLPQVKQITLEIYQKWMGDSDEPMTVPRGRQQLYASQQRRRAQEDITESRIGLSVYQIDPEAARLAGQRMSGKWGAVEKEAASKAALKSYERYGLTSGEKAAKQASEAKQNMEAAGWGTAEIEKVQKGFWNEFYGVGKGGTKGGGTKGENAYTRIFEEGEKIAESTNALDKYNRELERLKWFSDAGALSQEGYGKAVGEAWKELVEAESATEGWKEFYQVQKESSDVFSATRTDAEKYAIEIERLNYLMGYGFMTVETYNRQIENLGTKFGGVTNKMSEFAVQAAHNIQDALGDQLYNVMTGNFDNIGEAFGQMIAKMVAQAAAAQISEALFGNYGQTGQIGGLAGSAWSWVASAVSSYASSYGGGMASGGRVSSGTTYLIGEKGPELFTPGSRGIITPNSAISTQAPKVNINITNNTGQKVEAEQSDVTFDGESYHASISLKLLKGNTTYRNNVRRLIAGR